ncbi:hypothetical protein [Novosphingobium colocasiae]|uniref:hypothetical protein n=1 Tax=Novosphingobium colocasiae TaxID=1256513 RepID=UPI0035AFB6C5
MARTLLSAPPTERVGRYPKHTFAIRELPFTAQPFMMAPVLPGETLDNLYFESRVVTDPILTRLNIWKKEYYFFYVRITDLAVNSIRDMFIDPANVDLSSTLGVAASQRCYYTAKGGIDYCRRAMVRIVEDYFRDEGETFDAFKTSEDVAIVQIRDRFWLDSYTLSAEMPAGAAISAATNADDLEGLMAAYEQLRALGLAPMTYEDFLRSYGVAIPEKDEGKPELLARFTDSQYPSNTINPTDGTATSAVSWVFKNSARSPKFFKEPGFIVGVSVTRPKVYFGGVAGMASAHLSRAWDWVPNYMNEAAADPMPFTSLKEFAADAGPLGDRVTATAPYFLDMRDLFIHGDQFQNLTGWSDNVTSTLSNFSAGIMGGPSVSAPNNWAYPSEANLKSLFVSGTNYYVRQDGFVSLNIKGRQVDYTPGNVAEA